MKNGLIYLLLFFAFCVLSNGQASSKKDMSVASSCKAADAQYHIDGTVSGCNLLEFKYQPLAKKVVPLPGSGQQSTSTFFKLPVGNLRYCQTKNIGQKPPAQKLFHLNLYGLADNDDGDPHPVA